MPTIVQTNAPARDRRHPVVARLLMAIGALAILVQAGLFGVQWWRQRVPEAVVGQPAAKTITSPAPLRVLDPDATARLREEEGRKLAPLYRFDGRVAERQVESFLADYDRSRMEFATLASTLGSLPLDQGTVDSTTFQELVRAFQKAHPAFPLTAELAREWSRGAGTDELRGAVATAIRTVLQGYVVEEAAPDMSAEQHEEVWLSVAAEQGGVSDLTVLEQQARKVRSRSMVSVADARAQLRRELAQQGDAWGAFAAARIVANVTRDQDFTTALRAEATKELEVWQDFAAGAEVLRVGEPVTPVQAAALAELETLQAANPGAGTGHGWMLLVLGGFCLGAGFLIHRAPPVTMAVARVETPADLRAGVLQQLSGWLKTAFVQRLARERKEALEDQADAAAKLDLMEARLSKINPDIKARIATYEKRIAALEQELKDAGDVNRELIRTRIMMARKELEIEKARSNLVWN